MNAISQAELRAVLSVHSNVIEVWAARHATALKELARLSREDVAAGRMYSHEDICREFGIEESDAPA